jgi:hypothetical protein
MEHQVCIKCDRPIAQAEQAVAVFLFSQTVGIRPRRKSRAQRIHFCPTCAVSLALGPPPDGALNVAAYHMIRDLIGTDASVAQIAWQQLRSVLAPPMPAERILGRGVVEILPAMSCARVAG